MTVYIFTIFSVVAIGLVAQIYNRRMVTTSVLDGNGVPFLENKYFIFKPLIVFILIFVSGFRYYVGTDYGGYYKRVFQYEELIESLKELNEPLYALITFASRKIYDEGIFVIFVFSALTIILMFKGMEKVDQNDIVLFAFLYITTGSWLFSFNGVRQALAAAIIFAFANSKVKNSIMNIVIICFVAFLVHKSSIVMFPILILAKRRFDVKQIMIIIASGFFIPLAFDFIFEYMEIDTELESAMVYINHEINPIRVAVAFAPILVMFVVENKKEFFNKYSFECNMVCINALLMLTTANSAYLNRITQFTNLYIICYLPRALKSTSKSIRFIITLLAVILYFVYWLYEIQNAKGTLIPFAWSFSHFGEY